jgi:Zn-dependent alcohol dehydrogenase
MHEAKKINLTKLITKIENLQGINELISEMKSGDLTGRCLVKM